MPCLETSGTGHLELDVQPLPIDLHAGPAYQSRTIAPAIRMFHKLTLPLPTVLGSAAITRQWQWHRPQMGGPARTAAAMNNK
jgi:hypothetical protein